MRCRTCKAHRDVKCQAESTISLLVGGQKLPNRMDHLLDLHLIPITRLLAPPHTLHLAFNLGTCQSWRLQALSYIEANIGLWVLMGTLVPPRGAALPNTQLCLQCGRAASCELFNGNGNGSKASTEASDCKVGGVPACFSLNSSQLCLQWGFLGCTIHIYIYMYFVYTYEWGLPDRRKTY